MKKQISTIITVIVFVTGLSLLLYPTVSNYWNSLHQTKAVANYSDAMEKMDKQKKQDAIDAAKAYNEALLSNAGRFTPTEEELDTYKSLLNADGTGMMGYIEIPEIRCELAIYHTVDESVLQVGIGLWKVPACRWAEVERIVFYPGTEDFRVHSFLRSWID